MDEQERAKRSEIAAWDNVKDIAAENSRLRTECSAALREAADLHKEVERLKADYGGACELVAKMHGAVVGWGNGPIRGVVEDVEDLKARAENAEHNFGVMMDERDAALARLARLKAAQPEPKRLTRPSLEDARNLLRDDGDGADLAVTRWRYRLAGVVVAEALDAAQAQLAQLRANILDAQGEIEAIHNGIPATEESSAVYAYACEVAAKLVAALDTTDTKALEERDARVRREERESCAQVADDLGDVWWPPSSGHPGNDDEMKSKAAEIIAEAIRARGGDDE